MSLEFKNITGPVRYEKVVLRLRNKPYVMHFFSDDHVRVTSCKEDAVLLQDLVLDTLRVHKLTDLIYEGSDRQRSLVGNYLREFRNAFPTSCWEHHTCDAFEYTTFHSVDVRNVINYDWCKELFRLKTKEDELDVKEVTDRLLIELRLGGPESQQILRGWMHSLITCSGRIAKHYIELAEDWVKWICNGSIVNPSVEKIVKGVSYDKYILYHIGQNDPMYQDYTYKWIDEAYLDIIQHPERNVHVSLGFMVDIATIQVLLYSSNIYSILYMGHQHTFRVLAYLKQLASDLSYTQESFESPPTPDLNPVQCIRIPLENNVLSMSLDVFNEIVKEEPGWKYTGKSKKKCKSKSKKSKSKRRK
jgi:hypothetical protein